jgi:hypothetical protein
VDAHDSSFDMRRRARAVLAKANKSNARAQFKGEGAESMNRLFKL